MKIHVEELSPRNDDELIRFLNSLGHVTPSVLGYHYPFYRNLLVEIGIGQPVYLAVRLNGELAGFLPAFTRETVEGRVYSSLPYFGPNSGVLCSNKEFRTEIHTTLLLSLLSRAKHDNALSCSIYTPFLFDDFDLYDQVMTQPIIVDKFTNYLDLETATWSKKINYDLRKAEQHGVEISKEITSKRVDAFYAIYEQNCNDYGIPLKPKKCVGFLVDETVLGQHTDIYFAFHGGRMIGGLLMIWSPLTASYYIPCTIDSDRSLQSGTLLIDQAVKDARARGIRIWNWESSPSRESGAYQFKKKWGSVESSYRIYLETCHPRETFQKLGVNGISEQFPYYFVYPFHLV